MIAYFWTKPRGTPLSCPCIEMCEEGSERLLATFQIMGSISRYNADETLKFWRLIRASEWKKVFIGYKAEVKEI